MKSKSNFQMPTPMTITGRSSSITNAFISSIIPVIYPTEEEIQLALETLEMSDQSLECIYCGDAASEWDHLNPLVKDRKPTGYISEIHNLVPSCGKCNQSKGNKSWKIWIESDAELSPHSRRISDLSKRIELLNNYERIFTPRKIDFESLVDKKRWENHWKYCNQILEIMKEAQKLAQSIKEEIASK